MKINPIGIKQNQYVIKPSFQARSIEDRMNAARGDQGWFKWNVGGGKEAARAEAEYALSRDCDESERAVITAQERTVSEKQKFDVKLRQEQGVLHQKQATLNNLLRVIDENNDTIDSLTSKNDSYESSIEHNERQFQRLTEENYSLEEKNKENQLKINELNNEYSTKKKDADKILEKELEKTKNNLSAIQKQHLVETEKNLKDTDILLNNAIQNSNNKKIVGMSKIKGYDFQKKELVRLFGQPIEYIKNGHETVVPNGILLYGPQGCGKTTLARAFAESTGCNIEYYRPTISSQKAYNQLIDIAERAKNNFNTNKNHTFILIDEFDAFAPKESEKSKQMKNLTDKIAMQYHCSILATTNFPENIDKTLLRDGKFQKMAIPPATSADIKNIIKYYLNGVFIESTELNNIVNTIMGNENGSFSNSQIKDIIINCIKKSLLSNTKLESKHILQAFKENIPVITNNSLELFKKQISIVTKI